MIISPWESVINASLLMMRTLLSPNVSSCPKKYRGVKYLNIHQKLAVLMLIHTAAGCRLLIVQLRFQNILRFYGDVGVSFTVCHSFSWSLGELVILKVSSF